MKKTIINLLILAAVAALAVWGTKRYYPTVQDRTVTDTVRVDRPYQVTKIIEKEKPVRVTEYQTRTDTITKVQVKRDTLTVTTQDSSDYHYAPAFLTQYPTTPRFLGLEKTGRNLTLSYQAVNGQTSSKQWAAGTKDYTIGLSGGKPAIKTRKAAKTGFKFAVRGGAIISAYNTMPFIGIESEYSRWGLTGTASVNIARRLFATVGIQVNL